MRFLFWHGMQILRFFLLNLVLSNRTFLDKQLMVLWQTPEISACFTLEETHAIIEIHVHINYRDSIVLTANATDISKWNLSNEDRDRIMMSAEP